MIDDTTAAVGRILGTEDATPLSFWVAIDPQRWVQLDDVVALERVLPGGQHVGIYGVVSQVRARHVGARFDNDVFLIEQGVLPAEVSEAAQVLATRFEPESFVPPLPGAEVRRATGAEREAALYFDRMEQRLPLGLSRDGQVVFGNLEFIDGTRGAHINISGVSGVATKTTYATFLLYGLFHSGILGDETINTKALVFNVKGEDLLFLDRANRELPEEHREKYEALGLPAVPFASASFWAPPRRNVTGVAPDVSQRLEGVMPFFWTVYEFCTEDLLPFLFADARDETAQYTIVLHNVMHQLRRANKGREGAAVIEGELVDTFAALVRLIEQKLDQDPRWSGAAIGPGTISAFIRRLHGAGRHVEHLIRADVPEAERHTIRLESQLTVVDIHRLTDRAQRFVVGAVLQRTLTLKEESGHGKPLLFVVLDELNKYAPREGSGPIKDMILDIAERGRSLGVILIGAQQTASEVERRVIANASIRVVGRLDAAEASREEYGFLPSVLRQRATILKPGTMIVSQPEIPIPVAVEFPFPAWATRFSQAPTPPPGTGKSRLDAVLRGGAS